MSEEALTMPLLGAGASEPAGENAPDVACENVVPAAPEVPVKRVPTVYFIDDSATMREVIKIAFRRENINVITCGDAASALAQFEQNRPDVVITDVIMPDQDGYELIQQIRQRYPADYSDLPAIALTAYAREEDRARALSAGFHAHLTKRVDPSELLNRIFNLAGRPEAAPVELKLAR